MKAPSSALLLGLLAVAPPPLVAQGEERAVFAVVEQLFAGMRTRDTARMRGALHPEARLLSPARDGAAGVRVESPEAWLAQVARSTGAPVDERLRNPVIRVDGALASVWVEYSLYVGDRFVHCGVDAFHLVRTAEGWRIIDLADTRRRDRCPDGPDPLRDRVQSFLDSLRQSAGFPGATVGIALPDGRVLAVATGESDTARDVRLRAEDLLLAGSVGKTFFAALALSLIGEGRLSLDTPIAHWLGGEPWFPRLPNGASITVRQLMNHTSGLVRYEFKEQFTRDLSAQPDRVWRPEELIGYILDTPAPFEAGKGWDYSDTNYIVLGMILERITGTRAYDEITRRFLAPLGLTRVVPSTSRQIPGLVQGYAGPGNPFGGKDPMIADGRLAINPQFEWAGGGFATSAPDLARWARALYSGQVVDSALLRLAFDGVPARLGANVRYGLGVILWPPESGAAVGHSGFFPGYQAEMRYFPADRFAIAVQFNTSAPRALGRSPGSILNALAAIIRSHRP
jgi:D-alanyl-D-alanine carboxypeptidase